jgi:nucleotide-binding universal stress UspA family protein
VVERDQRSIGLHSLGLTENGLSRAPNGETSDMTRVLIAADESQTSIDAAQAAHRLFGDSADYFVLHVASTDGSVTGRPAPGVQPLVIPVVSNPPAAFLPGVESGGGTTAVDAAERTASEIAHQASLGSVEPIGDVGDPASAIIEAAHINQIDVIVVGSHDRTWFSRLFKSSVTEDVVRQAPVPVLVVK